MKHIGSTWRFATETSDFAWFITVRAIIVLSCDSSAERDPARSAFGHKCQEVRDTI